MSMRPITDHRTPGDPSNERLVIEADDPDARNGGASHEYLISLMVPFRTMIMAVGFQRGPVLEPNSEDGVTNEALIAIVIDRLRCFQQGDSPCPENAEALRHFHEGLHWLRERTLNRIAAGTEGRNDPSRVELCGWGPCNHAQSAHTRVDEFAQRTNACQLCNCSGWLTPITQR